jgi:hypothetical protein
MHEHIGLSDERQQHIERFRLLEIEHEPALAAIHAEKRAAFRFQCRWILAQVIARGRFDLDDFRALIREQRAAVRPGNVRAEIEHAHAG